MLSLRHFTSSGSRGKKKPIISFQSPSKTGLFTALVSLSASFLQGSETPASLAVSSSLSCLPVALPAKLRTRKPSSGVVASAVNALVGLLLHGVPDSPPLTGAGLQHQQVAEVNVGGHDLQTASAGSIDDGLVLRGGRRVSASRMWQISVDLWTNNREQSLLQVNEVVLLEPFRSKKISRCFFPGWADTAKIKFEMKLRHQWGKKKDIFQFEDWDLSQRHWRTSDKPSSTQSVLIIKVSFAICYIFRKCIAQDSTD